MIAFPLAMHGPMDPQLVSALLQADLSCFLPYQVLNDGQHPTDIEVDASGLPSLAEALAHPLSVRDLAGLFRQLHNLINACAYHGLPFMNVVLDVDRIYGDPLDDGLRFIYLPTAGEVKGISFVKDRFMALVDRIQANRGQAQEMLARFSSHVAQDEPLNIIALASLLGDLAKTDILDDPDEPSGSDAAPMLDDASGSDEADERDELDGHDEPDGAVEVDPSVSSSAKADDGRGVAMDEAVSPSAQQPAWASGRHVREDPGTSVLNAIDLEALSLESFCAEAPTHDRMQDREPTPVAQPDPFATTVLDGGICSDEGMVERGDPASQPASPALSDAVPSCTFCLTHRASGQRAAIVGKGLTVGKSKYAMFQVPNTTTVSRIHAKLSRSGGSCSIQDNDSLNGTFVNERRLTSHEVVPLADGDIIRMSDEEFLFQVLAERGAEGVMR